MKKSVIWVLACIMAIAFFGLLFMQLKYFSTIIQERSNQLDESIKRSLYQVSKNLELDETKKVFNESLIESLSKQDVESSEEINISYHNYISTTPDGNIDWASTTTVQRKNPKVISPATTSAISKMFLSLQEEQKKKILYNLDNVHNVLNQLMHVQNSSPIEERVNFRQMEGLVRSELKSNGIELPFFYQVVDRNSKVIYQQSGFDSSLADKMVAYSQVLFANDPGSKLTYMKVYFPSKRDYLNSEVRFLIPSLLFTFILLVTFIIMIIIVFRQKRLSEMKNDFMNNMTHELKTPVSTISLAAQMLKDVNVAKSPDVFKHISSVIGDETERLSFQV